MSMSRAQEVLFESEAILRLVDNELQHLRDGDGRHAEENDATAIFPQVVEKAAVDLYVVLDHLRHVRADLAGPDDVFPSARRVSDALQTLDGQIREIVRLLDPDPDSPDRQQDGSQAGILRSGQPTA